MTSKAELRTEFKQKRADLSLAVAGEYSRRIANGLFANVDLRKLSTLHTFIRIKRFNEIDTSMIYFRLWRDLPKLRTVAPRTDLGRQAIENIEFGPTTELIESAFGIREPRLGAVVPSDVLDAVLVPLLAFDENGHRVGYGGGFYDRFLAECRHDCLKIGLSYFEPTDEISDINENDIRLDLAITPNAVFNF